MRKIFFLSVLMFAVNWLHAQAPAVTLKPSSFTAEDEVTLTIDVTGTKMAGKTDAYLWIWCNAGAGDPYKESDGLTNGTWTGSKPAAKLISKGGNIFEYKFIGTVMFGKEPGQLKHFQFLVKTIDGGTQTDNTAVIPFEPIVFVPVPFRVFPNKLGEDDVATVNFHQSLAPTTAEQRMMPKTVTVKLFDAGGVQIGDEKTWNVKSDGNGVFSYSFIPSIAWSIPAGKKAGKFSYRFDGLGKDATGNTVTVTGTTSEKTIDALQ